MSHEGQEMKKKEGQSPTGWSSKNSGTNVHVGPRGDGKR